MIRSPTSKVCCVLLTAVILPSTSSSSSWLTRFSLRLINLIVLAIQLPSVVRVPDTSTRLPGLSSYSELKPVNRVSTSVLTSWPSIEIVCPFRLGAMTGPAKLRSNSTLFATPVTPSPFTSPTILTISPTLKSVCPVLIVRPFLINSAVLVS